MNLYVKHIEITPQDYAAILAQLRTYTNSTAQSDATDLDQPQKPTPKWVQEAIDADDELPL